MVAPAAVFRDPPVGNIFRTATRLLSVGHWPTCQGNGVEKTRRIKCSTPLCLPVSFLRGFAAAVIAADLAVAVAVVVAVAVAVTVPVNAVALVTAAAVAAS